MDEGSASGSAILVPVTGGFNAVSDGGGLVPLGVSPLGFISNGGGCVSVPLGMPF